jgi:hypothetical protein
LEGRSDVTTYYRLDWKVSPPDPSLSNTGDCPDLGVSWTMGARFARALPEPIVCSLNPKRGPKLRDLYLVDIPLFSGRLLEALRGAGVANLDSYAAELRSPSGEMHRGYFAVNVIGIVACAEMSRSEAVPGLPAPLIEFTRLVVDSGKAHGRDFFRLGENSLYILMSERIKDALDGHRFEGLAVETVETV